MAEGTDGRTPRQGSRPHQAQRHQARQAQAQAAPSAPRGTGRPHRRVGGDTGTIPVIDSTGSLPRGGAPRVEKTVVMSRDEIRRVAELEEGSRVHAGSTAEMPVMSGRQRRHIPDSDRPVVVETTGRRHARQAAPRQATARQAARPATDGRARSTSQPGRGQAGTRRAGQSRAARPTPRQGQGTQARRAQAATEQPGQARHARPQQRPQGRQGTPRHATGHGPASQVRPRQGRPRQAQVASPQRQHAQAQRGHMARQARPVRRRRGRLPVVAVVVALAILVLVVVSVARCNAARVAAEQAAQEQAQQEQEAQQQQQQTATEIAGLPEGTYYLEPADEAAGLLALDVSGVGDDAYTTVIATTMEQASGQQIRLDVSGDGSTCTLSHGELYLDVGDVTAGAGRSVFANKASGGDSQNWKIQQNDDGTYGIVSAAADYAIAVTNPYDGTQATCEEYDGTSTAQKFNIVSERRAEELARGTTTTTTTTTTGTTSDSSTSDATSSSAGATSSEDATSSDAS